MNLKYGNLKKNDNSVVLDGDLDGKFVFYTKDYLGKGNFGQIYRGRNVHTYEEVAIKLESINSFQLLRENRAYKILGVKKRNHNIRGFPEIYCVKNIGLEYMAMAMELLGPSLDWLLPHCGDKFSLKTVLLIAMQMVSRIEQVHSCKLLHRDIKPENMLIGLPLQRLPYKQSTEDTIYLIDFGLADLYIHPETDMHIPFNDKAGTFGTYHYMSVHGHLSIELSRRDDLETLGYVLVYLINGSLPWSKYLKAENNNNPDNNAVNLDNCREMKYDITSKDLCVGLPEEFVEYFDYVKQLKFSDKPDYEKLYKLFETAYDKHKFPNDNLFDWSFVNY